MIKRMETSNQIWYARTLKMLAEPAPVTLDEADGNINGTLDSAAAAPVLNFPSVTMPSDTPSAFDSGMQQIENHDMNSYWDGIVESNSIDATTFLGSIHPFAWFSVGFEGLDDGNCQTLFEPYASSSQGMGEEMSYDLSTSR